jgi:hypothetical protein
MWGNLFSLRRPSISGHTCPTDYGQCGPFIELPDTYSAIPVDAHKLVSMPIFVPRGLDHVSLPCGFGWRRERGQGPRLVQGTVTISFGNMDGPYASVACRSLKQQRGPTELLPSSSLYVFSSALLCTITDMPAAVPLWAAF